MSAHRRWHYTGPQGQPSRFVRWFCRSVDAPKPETLLNLWRSFVAWPTCRKPPWTVEAEEAEVEAAQAADARACATDADAPAHAHYPHHHHHHHHHEALSLDAHSVASSGANSAVQLRRAKRRLTAFGVAGVHVVWCVTHLPHASLAATAAAH
jgi:hypothetical protein